MKKIYEDIPKDQRVEELDILRPMLEDQFFFRTGLEVVYLEIVFTEHNMI